MSASFPKMMPPLNINRPQMLATENEQLTAHVYMYFYNLYVAPFLCSSVVGDIKVVFEA